MVAESPPPELFSPPIWLRDLSVAWNLETIIAPKLYRLLQLLGSGQQGMPAAGTEAATQRPRRLRVAKSTTTPPPDGWGRQQEAGWVHPEVAEP